MKYINKIYKVINMRALIIVLFFVLSQNITAQMQSYSLEDVIKIAQKQSPDAQIAKHNLVRNYWSYRTYKRSLLPQLDFVGIIPNVNRAYENYTNPDGSQSYVGQRYIAYSGELQIKKTIGYTGGSVFLSSGLQKVDNYYDTSATSNYLSTPLNIGISQPLFNYNPYKWSKKIEPLKYDESQRIYIETVETVSLSAVSYYFRLLKAQMTLSIKELNVQNYDTLYKLAKGRYSLGKIEENDLLQLELKSLQSQSAQEMARLNYDNALVKFKSFLRLPLSEDIILKDPKPQDFFIVDKQKALDMAIKNSSEILQHNLKLLMANSELDRAKKANGFNADLYAVFGFTQNADNLHAAYQNPKDQQKVSLGLKIPIYDWGQREGQVIMAESNLEIVKNTVEQQLVDFKQRIYLEVVKFNMQQNQLYIAAKSDTIAMRAFDITKYKYYNSGKISVTDLNIAQVSNDQARISYINALETYWNSYYNLRKSTLYDFNNNKLIEVDFDELLDR